MNILPDKEFSDLDSLLSDIQYKLDRLTYYGESIDSRKLLESVKSTLTSIYNSIESECEDCVRLEETQAERDRLEDEVADLQKQLEVKS